MARGRSFWLHGGTPCTPRASVDGAAGDRARHDGHLVLPGARDGRAIGQAGDESLAGTAVHSDEKQRRLGLRLLLHSAQSRGRAWLPDRGVVTGKISALVLPTAARRLVCLVG